MRYKVHILLSFLLSFLVLLNAEPLEIFGNPQKADLYLNRKNISIGYSHKYRQAIWVAYGLDAENLLAKQLRRKNKFLPDPAVKLSPVKPKDYNRTGYDKGHLAPAADMTYSDETMRNSFFMTNISPQIPGCNRGIWKRIETQVRKWALKEEKLLVITGPVFSETPEMMGGSGIPVPVAFYKVVFDLTPPMKMIAFIVPNETSRNRIFSFAVSVDEVERITGYDFFSGLDDEIENRLEGSTDFTEWGRQETVQMQKKRSSKKSGGTIRKTAAQE